MSAQTYRFLIQALCVTLLVFSHSVYAEQELNRDALTEQMWTIKQDVVKTRSAADQGEKFTGFCSNCHGINGIGKKPWQPNLAAQDATYLLNQLLDYREGTRRHQIMDDLVSHLSGQDMVNIALYYSTMENTYRPAIKDKDQIRRGKEIYTKNCVQCHMKDGMGKVGLARLAGQHPEYLIQNLRKFRFSQRRDKLMGQTIDNLTMNEVQDAAIYIFGNSRKNEVMGPIVDKLSDVDINDVAYYISSMVLVETE